MSLVNFLFKGKFVELTSFFSVAYLVAFLPLSLLAYTFTPKKAKKYCLLICSYIFFFLISAFLVAYLWLTTASMYYFGMWLAGKKKELKAKQEGLEKEEKKALKELYAVKQRRIVTLAVCLHIGFLLVLKYTGFFAVNINSLLGAVNVSFRFAIPRFFLPIGISFFTLQALSYILDVYYGKIEADGNFMRLALFISFFPQIVEGPICRYDQTADQLWNIKPITYRNLTFGCQRFLYGMLKKIVVADRLNPFVEEIFTNYQEYNGGVIALSAIAYTVQLYMDFSGSMDAVIGTAEIFGITLPENFNHPFFSKNISEFWTRWHISLGTWFKDYLFYPVTTSKRMKKLTSSARKKMGNHYGPLLAGSIALFAVWISNGLWHGAGWNFIFFGLYHFVFILIGSLINPVVRKMNAKLHINSEWKAYKLMQIIRTSVLVVIGELIFRSSGLNHALAMLKRMFTDFSFVYVPVEKLDAVMVDGKDFFIVGVTILIVLTVSILNEMKINIRQKLADTNIVVRWTVLYLLIIFIVIFGAYGFGYAQVDPLYAQY